MAFHMTSTTLSSQKPKKNQPVGHSGANGHSVRFHAVGELKNERENGTTPQEESELWSIMKLMKLGFSFQSNFSYNKDLFESRP